MVCEEPILKALYNFMVKTRFLRKIGLISVVLGFAYGPAFASEIISPEKESFINKFVSEATVSLGDLGIENPVMVQSNPFYFMKNLKRSTQISLSFSALRKAETNLGILNDRVAEIKQLLDLNSGNSTALKNAFNGYSDSLNDFKSSLEGLKNWSDSVSLNKFLDKAVSQSAVQIRIFDSLKKVDDLSVRDKLSQAQSQFVESLSQSEFKIESAGTFKNRLEKTMDSQRGGVFSGLFAVEIMGRFENQFKDKDDLFAEVLKLEENWLADFSVSLESAGLSGMLGDIFSRLPGDEILRIRALDDAREYAFSADFKNELGLARQEMLDRAIEAKIAGKAEADKAMSETDSLITISENRIRLEKIKSVVISQLITKAKFNLKQAGVSFSAGQYGQAFDQSSAALAAAKGALRNISRDDKDIQRLKSKYDSLISLAQEKEKDENNSPDLFSLLGSAEKALAKANDLLNKSSSLDKLNASAREALLLLAKAENLLNRF